MTTIEVFADISCPFTHVGLHRLVEQRTVLGRDDVVLHVRAWPLELVNGAPITGDFVGTEIDALRESVAPDLFTGFDARQFPASTIPVLSLAAQAYKLDGRLGEQVSLELRNALFEEGRNVGDPSELTAMATSLGIEPPGPEAERWVHDDWREGQERGVLGSPHFFIDDQGFFCPALKISHAGDELKVEIDLDAFEEFSATVFDR